jgi:hypothetical protein
VPQPARPAAAAPTAPPRPAVPAPQPRAVPLKNGQTQPAARPAEEEEGEAWEKLTPETDDPRPAAETGQGSAPSRPSTVYRTRPPVRMRPWWEMVLVGLMLAGGVLAALTALVVWLFFGRGNGGVPLTPPDNQPVLVNRAGGPGTVPSLAAALSRVKEGGRIIVQDTTVDEDLNLHNTTCRKGVTIEGEEGKNVLMLGAKDAEPGTPLVRVDSVEGLRLRNLAFDGGGRRDKLILLTGACPDTTLENVNLRGFTRCGVLVMNCKGAPGHPVIFRKLHLTTEKEAEAGLLFDVNPRMLIKINEFFLIQDCRFEGPFKAPVLKSDKTIGHLDWAGRNVHVVGSKETEF